MYYLVSASAQWEEGSEHGKTQRYSRFLHETFGSFGMNETEARKEAHGHLEKFKSGLPNSREGNNWTTKPTISPIMFAQVVELDL